MAAPCTLLELSCATFCPRAYGQTAGTGALGGVVSDPSGPAVTDSQIKATGETRGETRTVKSGTNGSYLVALLLPGLYEVEVAQSSFKTTQLLHVRIAVAETTTLNIRLEIGAVSEQIIVQGAAEQLQMESSTLGPVTEGEQIRFATARHTELLATNAASTALWLFRRVRTPLR
jgi:hypothetical protein